MHSNFGSPPTRASTTLDALAHELNQPVAAILTNAQVGLAMRAQRPSPEVFEILEDIEHEARRVAAIIERFRSLLQGHDVEPGTKGQVD